MVDRQPKPIKDSDRSFRRGARRNPRAVVASGVLATAVGLTGCSVDWSGNADVNQLTKKYPDICSAAVPSGSTQVQEALRHKPADVKNAPFIKTTAFDTTGEDPGNAAYAALQLQAMGPNVIVQFPCKK